ncbi:MAG: cystathionine beta-synthase [Candidatus Aldehydirespiratoraceae bacterium]|jgi:cystathionine beta-synthase
MEIFDSVLDMVGETPLVRLRRVVGDAKCSVVVKAEMTNPGGSSKDRPAIAMIDAAEREGLLKPGGTIVEPTSGNTGVGLAIVAAQRGYKCIFVMTDKVGSEKVDLLRAYGAEVVVCPVAVAPEDPASYYSTAERLVKEIPGAFRPNQYFNPANPQAHYESTGPEIWRQTDGKITHFVAGAGTGGTLSGVARYLKEQNPDIKIIAADPEGSVYSGGSGRPYLVEGVGEDFFPPNYDADLVDQTISVTDQDSFLTARRITREEGLLIGGSGGTAVNAALQVAETAKPDDLVVVLVPDNGRLYLSTVFDDKWMAGYGFLRAEGPVVADVLGSRRDGVPELLYVQPHQTVREAAQMMSEHGVSQLPVAKNEMPLATAEVMGSVSELRLMDLAFDTDAVLDKTVEDIMSPKLRTIGSGQPVALAVEMLESCSALLVLDGGRPRAVISSSDVLSFLSKGAFHG